MIQTNSNTNNTNNNFLREEAEDAVQLEVLIGRTPEIYRRRRVKQKLADLYRRQRTVLTAACAVDDDGVLISEKLASNVKNYDMEIIQKLAKVSANVKAFIDSILVANEPPKGVLYVSWKTKCRRGRMELLEKLAELGVYKSGDLIF